jgi:hypothetical protein
LGAGGEGLGDGKVGVFLELTRYEREEREEEEEKREEGRHWAPEGGGKRRGCKIVTVKSPKCPDGGADQINASDQDQFCGEFQGFDPFVNE